MPESVSILENDIISRRLTMPMSLPSFSAGRPSLPLLAIVKRPLLRHRREHMVCIEPVHDTFCSLIVHAFRTLLFTATVAR